MLIGVLPARRLAGASSAGVAILPGHGAGADEIAKSCQSRYLTRNAAGRLHAGREWRTMRAGSTGSAGGTDLYTMFCNEREMTDDE